MYVYCLSRTTFKMFVCLIGVCKPRSNPYKYTWGALMFFGTTHLLNTKSLKQKESHAKPCSEIEGRSVTFGTKTLLHWCPMLAWPHSRATHKKQFLSRM